MKPKADQTRLDVIHCLPCICCVQIGLGQPNKTEAHHLVDKGNRELSGGDQATIPICGWHHRAEPRRELNKRRMLEIYGPSLADHKKAFVIKFGTERELLAKTNDRLRYLQ